MHSRGWNGSSPPPVSRVFRAQYNGLRVRNRSSYVIRGTTPIVGSGATMSYIAWESKKSGGEWLQRKGEVFASAPRRKHVVVWVMYVVRRRVVRIQEDLVTAPHAANRVRMCSIRHMKETDRMVESLLYPCVPRSRDVAEQWTMNLTRLRWKHSMRKHRWSSDIAIGMTNSIVGWVGSRAGLHCKITDTEEYRNFNCSYRRF